MIEKVDQANSTITVGITVGISAGGERWVWESEKGNMTEDDQDMAKKWAYLDCGASNTMHLAVPLWAKSSRC